ncbi:MAG TPA: YetF domain-containing protein [Terriglobales bacterium]|nr:YetF domain-containing protein [Terriglobales bacterium]
MHASARVLAEIFIRTASIYLVILIGVRLSGKREVGQMTPFDLTLLLLLSNAVQNAMTGPDTSLWGGVVAACTLLLMNYLVAELSGVNRRFRRFVQGSPTLLIHDGQLLPSNLAREHLTVDEVERALREHGIASVKDVSLAVLEVDGSISALKYDDIIPGHQPHPRLRFLQKHQ